MSKVVPLVSSQKCGITGIAVYSDFFFLFCLVISLSVSVFYLVGYFWTLSLLIKFDDVDIPVQIWTFSGGGVELKCLS